MTTLKPIRGCTAKSFIPTGETRTVVSDTVTYRVVEGESWGVTRNSNSPTAPATPTDGSTIVELAYEVGLNPHEFRNWLTITGGSTVNLLDGSTKPVADLEVYDVLSGTQTVQFAVPNTILMAWFGEVGGWGKHYMNWEGNISDLTRLGFMVETFDNDSFAGFSDNQVKSVYKNLIDNLSANKKLHGLYMMGHGSNNFVGSEGERVHTVGPEWSIAYTGTDSIASVLYYKIGTLLIYACHSDNPNAQSLVSNSGIFIGQDGLFGTGLYIPIPDRIAQKWGYRYARTSWLGDNIFEIGGKQHTHIFEE